MMRRHPPVQSERCSGLLVRTIGGAEVIQRRRDVEPPHRRNGGVPVSDRLGHRTAIERQADLAVTLAVATEPMPANRTGRHGCRPPRVIVALRLAGCCPAELSDFGDWPCAACIAGIRCRILHVLLLFVLLTQGTSP